MLFRSSFSRALPKNLQELSQIVANLQNNVSAKTLLKLLPFVEDPDYEIEEVEKQKAEEVKRQQELFGMGANTPPDFEDDEEEDPAAGPEEQEEGEEKAEDQEEEEQKKEKAAGSKE